MYTRTHNTPVEGETLQTKVDEIRSQGRQNQTQGVVARKSKISHLATENPPHSATLIKFQGAQGRETGTKWAGTTPPPFPLSPPPYVEPTRCEFQRKGKFRDWGGTRVSHTTHTPLVTLLQASIQPTSAPRTYLALNREDHFYSIGAPPSFCPDQTLSVY